MTEPIVTVKQGQLRGKSSVDYHGGTFYSFCGIPYAKSPVGELRFKAPQPPVSWEGIRDATKDGWECPSLDMYFAYFIGKEDNCLNLNVHTKKIPTESDEKKPVMVWIHGGGFMYGSNKCELFGPEYLMSEDIVFVSINYRLGIFGFLSLDDQSLGVPGNAGLKDQVMALKWVQQNIHNFGGDPNNVTIFGESAGSASVHLLTLSPLTKGLFHKAIMQSGSSLNIWAKGKRNNGVEVAKCLKYKETDEKSILGKLMKESTKNIVNAEFKIDDNFHASTWRPLGPVVEPPSEEAFITEEPREIIKSGKAHQVPAIIGFCSLEGIFFEIIKRVKAHVTNPTNLELDVPHDINSTKNSNASTEIAEKIKKFYYNGEAVSDNNVKDTYLLKTDVQFVYGIQKSIKLHLLHAKQPIYVYRNSLDGPLNFFKKIATVRYFKTMFLTMFLSKVSSNLPIKSMFKSMVPKFQSGDIEGVAHADDLFYLFPNFFTPKIVPGSKEDTCIQLFVKLWTNFAKYGNPTPQPEANLQNVIWKPVENENIEPILEINEELKLTSNLEKERIQFWEEIYKNYS